MITNKNIIDSFLALEKLSLYQIQCAYEIALNYSILKPYAIAHDDFLMQINKSFESELKNGLLDNFQNAYDKYLNEKIKINLRSFSESKINVLIDGVLVKPDMPANLLIPLIDIGILID